MTFGFCKQKKCITHPDTDFLIIMLIINMEGYEIQKAEGIKMSNKVTVKIEKYKGKIAKFQHEQSSFAISFEFVIFKPYYIIWLFKFSVPL